jgi:hypothetical protein
VAILNNKWEAMLIMEYLKDLTVLVLLDTGWPPNPTANLQRLYLSPLTLALAEF